MNILQYAELDKAWYRPRHPFVAGHDIGLASVALLLVGVTSGYPQWYFMVVIMMFTVSAIHHWLPFQSWHYRLDRAMIHIMIAGTPLPYTQVILDSGKWWLLALLWTWAATFSVSKLVCGCLMYQGVLPSAAYLVTGVLGVFIFLSIDAPSLWWIFTAWCGIGLYLLQLLSYNQKWFDFYPELFGYREFQHLILLLAVSCHTAAIFIYVM